MRIAITEDAREFERRAGPFLASRLECNVLATVLQDAVRGFYDSTVFATVVDGDAVVGAALRTPPRALLCGPLPAGAAETLVEVWLAHDPELPGVTAPAAEAAAIAAAWSRRTGRPARVETRLAWHVLDRVSDPPHPTPGTLRVATPGDLEILTAWWVAFGEEAMPGQAWDAARDAADTVAAGRAYLWEDDGEAVSTVGVNPPVAGVVRVGPVYTPPELRRRGYAGAATAAVSRRMLATVASRCMLTTDLANETSNKIYREVGYRRFADLDEYRFEVTP
jgi:RimJ/RimL family protein N-acetyltransferase